MVFTPNAFSDYMNYLSAFFNYVEFKYTFYYKPIMQNIINARLSIKNLYNSFCNLKKYYLSLQSKNENFGK